MGLHGALDIYHNLDLGPLKSMDLWTPEIESRLAEVLVGKLG